MASIRDSVIDQYGNAVPGATVVLLNNDTAAVVATVQTNADGFFEFNNLANGQYRLQISGNGFSTKIIFPIQAVDPYPLATTTNPGLMSAADKAKLDVADNTPMLSELDDVQLTALAGGDWLNYNSSGHWYNVHNVDMPFPLKSSFTTTGGTVTEAGMYPQLTGLGRLDYSFLNVTPVGGATQYGQRIPVLDVNGLLDFSMYPVSQVGGIGYAFKIPQLNAGGLLDTAMINTATVGGASSANKIPKLNASGRVDPSMLPTTSGTFRGSVNLTIAYADPGWADGDYGANSTAGAVDATWNAHLNDPIPTTVKVGDNVYFTGGKFSVVPTTTDLDAYLPRDGSRPMTGQLSLIDQSAALPSGVQAVSRAAGDLLYQTRQAQGAIPSVTQTTSKSTGVSLNAITGQIVMHNESLATAAMAGPRPVKFTLTNSQIEARSQIAIQHFAGGTPGKYRVWTAQPLAGSVDIYVENINGLALAQAITLQFTVMK